MIYSDFQGKKLSALGMGCMRLPCVDGDNSKIDMDAAREMFAYAFEKGINYFDTAWGYHNGQSELAVGELLSEYPRESFYLASKFPGYDVSNMDKVEEIFEKQLKKCRVDYFDFYLFHNVCEKNINEYLDEKFGIYEYLMKQKKNGRIKHLGFSTHGSLHTMKRFLDAYGKDMEFCQLQINWLDWEFQNAKAKAELVASYGIPVWVMEPVRGGSLVKLAPEHEAELRALRPTSTMAEWAFRFLQGLDGVKVTLSGMSNFEQLKENIETYETAKPLNKEETEALFRIAREKTEKTALPCTSCRYCTEHCPMELDIPWFIELYNEHVYSGGGFIAPMALEAVKEDKRPSACLGCRACEEVCPQGIKISEMMADFAKRLKD
ncbi:MAG: aldo/keto reductase [Clostridia bacterium]|nr:aldo/keto reductase [Clostridia bacterium]